MTEKQDLFAPISDQKGRRELSSKADFVWECLTDQYRRFHGHEREEEMRRLRDGFTWQGPSKFALPINLINEQAPNIYLLRSVEKALCGIVSWPNARGQAYQLGRYIKYGAEDCKKEIFIMNNLIAKIAREQPYGVETSGTKLLRIDWEAVWWDGGEGIMDIFKETIEELTDFSKGNYMGCLEDYPMGPFWHLKDSDSISWPEKEKEDYKRHLIETRYPILLEHPELAKRQGIVLPSTK